MCDTRQSKGVSVWIVVWTILPLLAACGGGDDSPSAEPSLGNPDNPPLICLLHYILFNGVCVEDVDDPPPVAEPPPESEPPPAGNSPPGRLVMRTIIEVEPNNDLSMANAASMPSRTEPENRVGFFTFSTINDLSDTVDAFAFTVAETRTFHINLCPPGDGPGCPTQGLDVFTAFFRILDQSGNVLLTSQADELQGNIHSLTFDAGVLYYVTVFAGDTMTADVEYKLGVFEHNK